MKADFKFSGGNIVIGGFQCAAYYHHGIQRRHNKSAYMNHVIRVTGRFATRPSATPGTVCGVANHDVPEDLSNNQEEQDHLFWVIGNNFGPEAERTTRELTNPTKFSKAPRAERKAQDREHLSHISLVSKEAKVIDRIDNIAESIMDTQRGLIRGRDLTFSLTYADETELLIEAIFKDPATRAFEDLRIELVNYVDKLREVTLARIEP